MASIFILFTLYSFFFFPYVAHAYLDPGVGSMLVQFITAGIAGIAVVAKLYWKLIGIALKGRSGEEKNLQKEKRS